MNSLHVKAKRVRNHALALPNIQTKGAAAMDLRACLDSPVATITLYPSQEATIGTGFALEIPQGTALLLLPRSGLGIKAGLVLANNVGLIDPDYRGEIMVALWYRRSEGPPIQIHHGERIAQALLVQSYTPALTETTLTTTTRGTAGLGSTGVNP